MNITLFDTAVCSENVGDQIIMDAVYDELNDLFPHAMVINSATHERISTSTYNAVKKSELSLVGGTNLLSSNMNRYNQWNIGFRDARHLKEVLLMGVGWWQYQRPPNFYTRKLLGAVLDKKKIHSVRDSYSEKMLRKAGFDNVINTACPTMWKLDENHCGQIPVEKSDNVIFTITDYLTDPLADKLFIETLINLYDVVYMWPQGEGDVKYLDSLGLSKPISVLPPKLSAYDRLLKEVDSLDYVGTRLHAGIRALQRKRRALILAIDNRAIEKSKDFGLNVCNRGDISDITSWLKAKNATRIKIPIGNIQTWKSQFL